MKLKSMIISLILGVTVYYVLRPSITFTPNGAVRGYGVGFDGDDYKRTFFTMEYIVLIMAILIYAY